jgi:WD40 repeat protein
VREIQAYKDVPGATGGPVALAVADDGNRVYSCGIDFNEAAAVKVWSVMTGKQIQALAQVGPKPVTARDKKDDVEPKGFPTSKDFERRAREMQRGYSHFLLLKGGKHALLAGNTGNLGYLALWDLANDKAIWKLEDVYPKSLEATPDGRVSLAMVFADSSFVAYGGDGVQIHTLIASVGGRVSFPTCFAVIPPEGKQVITGATSGMNNMSIPVLALWEFGKREPLAIWRADTSSWAIESLAVSADGKNALVGRVNQILEYWDLSTGKVIATLVP